MQVIYERNKRGVVVKDTNLLDVIQTVVVATAAAFIICQFTSCHMKDACLRSIKSAECMK